MLNNYGQFPTYTAISSYRQIIGQNAQQNPNNYYQNFQPQPNNFNQQPNITFINGIEGAKVFQMSPNSSALLLDSTNFKFYVKITDSLGVAKIFSYSFTEDKNLYGSNQTSQDTANIDQLNKEEYDSLVSKVSELEVKTDELSSKLAEVF